MTVAIAAESGPAGSPAHAVERYLPLVRHAASRIGAPSYSLLQYEDMVSCGLQGLLEAHRSYDAARGASFATYALPRIRGAILDALRSAHPLSRSLQRAAGEVEMATSVLRSNLGRTPTRAELEARLGLSKEELAAALRAADFHLVSLEALATLTAGGVLERLAELADADPNVDPALVAEQQLLRRAVLRAVDELPPRERSIVRLYYLRSHTLKSIARRLKISESRTSQLRHRAIRRLRGALSSIIDSA